MYCSHCGKEIPKKARFCSDCGKETDRINVNVDIPNTINVENRIRTGSIISPEKLLCVKKWIATKTLFLFKIILLSYSLAIIAYLLIGGCDLASFLYNHRCNYSYKHNYNESPAGFWEPTAVGAGYCASIIVGIYILISIIKWIQFYTNKKSTSNQ